MQKEIRILVTDDEEGVRESFRMALKDSYKILTADCGKECIRMVKDNTPQLVFLDVRLPDMDGIDVLKEIKSINTALPVIIITGVGTHKIAIEALKSGADDFIAKPLNFYYVRSSITNCFLQKEKSPRTLPSIEDVITKNYLSTLKLLSRILKARNPATWEHSERVAKFAVKMAQELGLSQEQQEVMQQTALLHDIGKVGVSEFILSKANRLSPQEWAEIKRHVQIGEEFLQPLQFLHIEQSMLRHQHERYDGKGYPDRLKGEEIPLYARILTVADAYDTMTAGRPYRKPLNPIEALTEMERCSGTQFDPKIVKAFAALMRKDRSLLKRKDE